MLNCVQEKKRRKSEFFLEYLLQNSRDSDEIWYTVFWINSRQNDVNVSHLIWIMSPHYLVKLQMLIRTCYRWVVIERNSRIYPTLAVASKFARFESSRLQRVGNVAREGVHNTHHCSGAINDATDEWLPQWRHSPVIGVIGTLCSQS